MSSENNISIHEFSRGFQNIHYSDRYNRLVSGGYGKPIDRATKIDVPEQIKQAVENQDFAINDNYPPQEGKVALIARDVDRYSVLAVATGEIDDRNRPTIAYRYFWLEKAASEWKDLDGVGTLLVWWNKAGKPRYNFDRAQNAAINLEQFPTEPKTKNDFKSEKDEGIVANINKIPHIDLAKKNTGDPYPFARECHSLALSLQEKFGQDHICWAWNVRWLQHPEQFALVLSADADSETKNKQNLRRVGGVVPTTRMAPTGPIYSANSRTRHRALRADSKFKKILIFGIPIIVFLAFVLGWLLGAQTNQISEKPEQSSEKPEQRVTIVDKKRALLPNTLERVMSLYDRIEDKEAKKWITENLKSFSKRIDGANTRKDQEKVRKDKSYEFISSEYTARVLFKKNPEGRENQMKKDGENNEPEDVEKVQKMLKSVLPSYEHGEVDGIYGETTEKAVKEFQKLQEFTHQPGSVDGATWKAMTQRFTDKQVAVAAQFLLKSFETYDGSKPEQISSDIDKLKECKKLPIAYIDCVNDLINNQASTK